MSIDENKIFVKENEVKITNYIEHINSLSFLDETKLDEGLDTLNSLNPKVMELWELIQHGEFMCSMFGGNHWYNKANWINILQEFEPTITEIIDYFTDLYPIFFQSKGL